MDWFAHHLAQITPPKSNLEQPQFVAHNLTELTQHLGDKPAERFLAKGKRLDLLRRRDDYCNRIADEGDDFHWDRDLMKGLQVYLGAIALIIVFVIIAGGRGE